MSHNTNPKERLNYRYPVFYTTANESYGHWKNFVDQTPLRGLVCGVVVS